MWDRLESKGGLGGKGAACAGQGRQWNYAPRAFLTLRSRLLRTSTELCLVGRANRRIPASQVDTMLGSQWVGWNWLQGCCSQPAQKTQSKSRDFKALNCSIKCKSLLDSAFCECSGRGSGCVTPMCRLRPQDTALGNKAARTPGALRAGQGAIDHHSTQPSDTATKGHGVHEGVWRALTPG